MTPDELLNPENLPEDLHWLAAEFRLNPTDPVFLLIAWHWQRVQQGEDSLRAATIDLKTAVDSRIESLENAANTIASVNERLSQVLTVLQEKPLSLGRQLEADLRQPVSAAVEQVRAFDKALATIVRTAETTLAKARRRQALATFVIGLVLGAGAAALLW